MLYRLLNKISRKLHTKTRRTKKKRNRLKTLAGLTLLSTLAELDGFVFIQCPEKEKKFS